MPNADACFVCRGVGVEARDGSFASFEEVLLLRADPEVFDALAIGLWYDGPQNAVAGEGCLIL